MSKNRLPTYFKQLKGTYRVSREKSREVKNIEPLTRRNILNIKKPSALTPGASRYWDMIIDRLIKIGSIDVVDDIAISILCESLAEYEEMTRFLSEHGRVYTFKNSKNEVVSRARPEVRILNDCWNRIFQLLKEYGLTFKSRTNITPVPLEQTPNVWANLRRSNEK